MAIRLAIVAALFALLWTGTGWADTGPDFDLPPVASLWQFVLLLLNLDEVVETVAFYSCLSSILVILIGVTLALRQHAWVGYTALCTLGLVWIALNEQHLSGIYWSGIEISKRGLVTLGYVMASANFALAAWATPNEHWQGRLRLPVFTLAFLCWVTWPIGQARPENLAMLLINITGILSGLSHAIPISTFTRIDGQPDRLLRRALIAIGGIALAVVGVVGAGIAGADVDIIFINRVLLFVVVAFLSMFFGLHIKDIRADRDAVVAQSLADAQREAQVSRDLLTAQTEHARTLEVARLQRLRLAEASHDIRQPITSLRTTLAALTAQQPPEVKQQLNNAFDYLDQLATSYMDEARSDAPLTAIEDDLDDRGGHLGTETVSAALLIQTLESMFREDAEKAGHSLVVTSEDITVDVAPLALMRILSNLVSNAIKHSDPGPIRLGVLRDGAKAVFVVSNPGAPPVADDFTAYVKGEASDGQGLGLAIVADLARSHGYEFSLADQSSNQTTFHLGVPQVG